MSCNYIQSQAFILKLAYHKYLIGFSINTCFEYLNQGRVISGYCRGWGTCWYYRWLKIDFKLEASILVEKYLQHFLSTMLLFQHPICIYKKNHENLHHLFFFEEKFKKSSLIPVNNVTPNIILHLLSPNLSGLGK